MNSGMNKNLAILAVIFATVIWGANATFMKYTLEFVPPFSLGFLRFFGASLLFLPFVFKKINLKDISPIIVLTGLIGITAALSLFFIGLKLTTALNAGVIVAFSPILTLIAARILLGERIRRTVLVGALLGILGIGIIIGKDFLSSRLSLSPLGDFLILVSILASVFYSIYSKKILMRFPPLLTTFYVLGIGSLGFIPGALSEWSTDPNWFAKVPFLAILGILYVIILSSFLGHFCWQWALSRMEAGKVGVFNYIEPVVTTITAIILLSERITFPFVVGSLFIFSGLLIAEVHRHRHLHPPHHR